MFDLKVQNPRLIVLRFQLWIHNPLQNPLFDTLSLHCRMNSYQAFDQGRDQQSSLLQTVHRFSTRIIPIENMDRCRW